jgi:hypothetical protein
MGEHVGRGLNWVGLPVIANIARLLCRSATEPRTVIPAQGVAGVGGSQAGSTGG